MFFIDPKEQGIIHFKPKEGFGLMKKKLILDMVKIGHTFSFIRYHHLYLE